ncbi:hypothetical protein B2J86_09965 [Acidovorax sp. SRB_14]|uniref:glycosyltransferase family 39 protein n=1 Tax=Acidovorax sp. SRB_14 TaxID=1962699 RepID=UPI001565719E|nr:glycosyltransferase family 39 protein [Acidovorax sp. SRB_14]NMM81244.1 hypothetical protein [Acidovorax sp. SRB_14]
MTRADAQMTTPPPPGAAAPARGAQHALQGLASVDWTWAILGLFGVLWLWHLSSVALSPPADNIEQLTWVRSLQWGYYKHPPLPTWALWAFVQVAGWSAWSSYLLGALCTLASLALYAALLREMYGRHYALVGLLAALCITFYNGRLYYYNHNTALTLWVAASAWLWWRILTRPQLRWWLALGVVAAAGMLSKYQYAVTALCGLWLFARHGLWRDPLQRRGLVLAVAVALALVLPHALWLLQQERGPIAYAMQSSLGAQLGPVERLTASTKWLADWLLNRCLPALLLLVAVWWAQRRLAAPGARLPPSAGPQHAAQTAERGASVLLCWGLLPPLFMAAMGVLGGVDLQLQWGTAFAMWTVPALMAWLRLREEALAVRRVLVLGGVFFVLLQALLVWQSYDSSAFGRHRPRSPHWREFASEELALAVAGPARQALGGPISIIRGPATVSGVVALWLPEQPRVLIDGNLAVSPWIAPGEPERLGVLNLWPPGTGPEDAHRVRGGWGWSVQVGTGADPASH